MTTERRWHVNHAGWELFLMRLFFALALAWSLRSNWPSFTSQPAPNGLAHWVDFSFLGNPELMRSLERASWACLAAYIAGLVPIFTLGFPAFVCLGSGTLMNSQGAIGHSTQLITMVALAQWLVYFWGAIRHRGFPLATRAIHNLAVDWTMVVIAAGYTACGLTKIINTGGAWIARSPLLSLQLIKANDMDYYNRLEESHDFWAARLPELIVHHPWAAWLLFGTGLLLELFCFLAMLGRRSALALGLGLIAMHLSISKIMRLDFEDHINLLLIFYVNLPFWIAAAWGLLRNRRRAPAGPPPHIA